MKKYQLAGEVGKGKGKSSSPSIMSRIDRGLDVVGDKIKSMTIDKISNAAKSALASKPAQIAKKVIGYHKTGGSVGKSKKK